MLGGGDMKTIEDLNKAMPYGPGIVIYKEECVGHVAKHFYKRLEATRCKCVPNREGE